MTDRIVDTNVPLVASGANCDASPECQRKSVDAIKDVLDERTRLVIDDKWLILREYMNKLNSSGQPRIGDEFLKWVLTNRSNTDRCLQVEIQCDQTGEPLGFPHTQELHSFDRSDRKFAVTALEYIARNSPQKAPVLNATDSDWWHHRNPLAEAGIEIEFLCQDEILKWSSGVGR